MRSLNGGAGKFSSESREQDETHRRTHPFSSNKQSCPPSLPVDVLEGLVVSCS